MGNGPIRAVIGVSHRASEGGQETFYVRRSDHMENYPGVWSLPSIQYEPAELPDPFDLDAASRIFARMSAERFGSATIRVEEWLTAGRSDENPMQRMVELVLYRVSIDGALALNPRYYTDCGWLKRPDFKIRTMLTPLPCGLCTRLWEAHEDSL